MELRNNIIADCKANPRAQTALAQLYFGLKSKDGRTDLSYPSSVNAILAYTDDCIWFTKRLIDDLVEHGKALTKSIKRNPPKISAPEFTRAIELKLIPDDVNYASWLSAFKSTHPTMRDLL
jgi:hypothetical protein